MKKLMTILLILTIGILTVISIPAQSEEISVEYDGEALESDVSPEIIDNRVMVPMRTIFEMFGAKIKWDGETKTVTAKKNSKTIEMTVGSTEMKKNETIYSSDVAPVIRNGRTLIPVRAVSELLGLQVEWGEDSRKVVITSKEEDDSWKENKGSIDLSSMTVTGEGISVSGNTVTITGGGDFEVVGNCEDGGITIDSEDKVKLRLSGMSLENKSGSAIYIKNADKAYITLTEGTENYLTDGESYGEDDDKQKGCITARDNLEIKGKGSLEITGNNDHGIYAADSLKIENGNIRIEAKNDGIHVNDSFSMSGGELSIKAEGDGIHSEEIVDITGGTVDIETTGNVPSKANEEFGKMFNREETAESDEAADSEDVSSKGIKAGWLLEISGGDINIVSTDHAIHSASDMNIGGGNITISSENKGISAHGDLVIDNGVFNITKATEGIEGKQLITINDGEFNITASDDGINAGGGDSMFGHGFGGNNKNGENGDPFEGMTPPDFGGENGETKGRDFGKGIRGNRMAPPDMQRENGEGNPHEGDPFEGMTPPDFGGENGETQGRDFGKGMRGNRMAPPDMQRENGEGNSPEGEPFEGMTPPDFGGENGETQGRGFGGGFMFGGNSTEISSEHHIQINGGKFYILAKNDGIDSNGSITIEGGTVITEGREFAGGGELGLDSDLATVIKGGEVLSAGTTIIEDNARQNTALIYLSESIKSGDLFEIRDSKNNTLISLTAGHNAAEFLYSSDKLKEGADYTVFVNGEEKEKFTVSGSLTTVGTASSGGMRNEWRGTRDKTENTGNNSI